MTADGERQHYNVTLAALTSAGSRSHCSRR